MQRLQHLCYFFNSCLFFLGMSIATVIHSLLSLIFKLILPQRLHYQFTILWSRFIIFWLRITCQLTYEVKGKENLKRDKPAIILSNHQSAWETIAFQSILPPQTWVIKKQLLYIPFFGWGLWALGPIAIDRSSKFSTLTQIKQQGKKALNDGRYVVIFPEGTRVKPGTRKSFSRSGALLAHATGYAVIPLAHNAGLFWPRGGFIKKPGKITVFIGAPIDVHEHDANTINALAQQWITEKLDELKA